MQLSEQTGPRAFCTAAASLFVARDGLVGNATLQWRAAGSALTPLSPLGDNELRLEGEGMTVHALLRTIEGPLRLDGKGSWTLRAPAQLKPRRNPAPAAGNYSTCVG